MPEKEERGVLLRVAEARPSDVGRGLARMDPRVQRQLGLSAGDIIEIIGKKSTAALIWPGYR
ncbi:TPA: hypothetical protein EYP13_01900, partial [Candidatus Micrarchaeota archaeon]|nr:hypothetical protein [Candidatus Micrarchaeota archaeon]